MPEARKILAHQEMSGLVDQIEKTVHDFIDQFIDLAAKEDQKSTPCFQVMYECLAYQLGYLDGLAGVSGVDLGDRLKSWKDAFDSGKRAMLEQHDECCTSAGVCPAGSQIRQELDPN